MIRADLHNHLRTFTHAKEGDFDRAVDKAYQKLGAGGILSLVNFADTRYEIYTQQTSKYQRQNLENSIYIPEKKILILKGQEVQTKQGHLLILALKQNQHLKSNRNLEDAIKEAKDLNGIIIADHPFYKEGIGPYLQQNLNLLENIDALELNGEANYIPKLTPKNANQRLIEFHNFLVENDVIFPPKGIIASSDGHSFFEIGSCYTYIEKLKIDTAEILTERLRYSVRNSHISDTNLHHSIFGTYLHVGLLVPWIIGVKAGIFKSKNTN